MEPAPTPRDHEGDEVGDVLGRAETGNVDVLAVPLTDFGLALAGAFDIGLDAPPEPLGLHIARMDGIDLHVVGLAEIRERLGEGRASRIHRAADGEGGDWNAPAGAPDGDDGTAGFPQQGPSGAG